MKVRALVGDQVAAVPPRSTTLCSPVRSETTAMLASSKGFPVCSIV